jgi:cyclic di-GMP phosphodiesterase
MKDMPARLLLQKLEASRLLAENWRNAADHAELIAYTDAQALLTALVQRGLLTLYQADRIKAGALADLRVGNYRIVENLGTLVFRGEHVRLHDAVAIKIVPWPCHAPGDFPESLFGQLRKLARLGNPHIAAVVDTGELISSSPDVPVQQYFITRYIPGHDLEDLVTRKGPLTAHHVCSIGYQLATALAEAHAHNLVHGDLKPSNIRISSEGNAHLLNFVLSRAVRPRSGAETTLAQEKRLDLTCLGRTIFWCLTGKAAALNGEGSRRILPPGVPCELAEMVSTLLAPDAPDSPLTADMAVHALAPLVSSPIPSASEAFRRSPSFNRPNKEMPLGDVAPAERTSKTVAYRHPPIAQPAGRILIVDDEPAVRHFSRLVLQAEGLPCDEAANGAEGLKALQGSRYDLILLDIDMPVMNGLEVCRRLRENPPDPHLKIIMFSGRSDPDDMAQLLLLGADDYLIKPFSPTQLQARVQASLRLKSAQERSDHLYHELLTVNKQLEQHLNVRAVDLLRARNGLVLALAKLAEYRDTETGMHLLRIQTFSRRLAEQAARSPAFAGQIDDHFIDMLACCAPLHDIGKVGLPDHILLKPARLDPDERILMQAHTTMGAETLEEVARQHGFALPFFQMSIDITRHHHERYDGNGYPDRRAGGDIPLAARIVTICDVYDALRSRRVYKSALSHETALHMMRDGAGSQFDPALLQIFMRSANDFRGTYDELAAE